jgi:hypothetical protein
MDDAASDCRCDNNRWSTEGRANAKGSRSRKLRLGANPKLLLHLVGSKNIIMRLWDAGCRRVLQGLTLMPLVPVQLGQRHCHEVFSFGMSYRLAP